MTPTFIKSFTAAAAVAAYSIVKFPGSGVGDTVSTADSADALSIGVSNSLGCDEAGQQVDVIQAGWAELRLGGTVVAGNKLTSDATGFGVALPTGESQQIAIAMKAGVSGDIIPVLLAPATANVAA